MTHVLGRGCRRVRRLIGMTPDSSKVLVLFVGFDRTRYARAHAAINTLVGEFARGQATLVRIDNAQESLAARETGPYEFTIGGDNTSWEFSGWQRGLDFAIARGIAFDHAVFVNDAFLNGERDRFGLSQIRAFVNAHTICRAQRGLLGKIDRAHLSAEIDGLDTSQWIRSCAFAMDRTTATSMPLAAIDPRGSARFLTEEYTGRILRAEAPVSPSFDAFLTDWISRRWRGGQTIGASNWPFIRLKVIAILNERLLTARLFARGTPVWACGRVVLTTGASQLTRLPDARISSAP